MRGWIVSNTMRANRHWQSGSGNNARLNLFKDYTSGVVHIKSEKGWYMFTAQTTIPSDPQGGGLHFPDMEYGNCGYYGGSYVGNIDGTGFLGFITTKDVKTIRKYSPVITNPVLTVTSDKLWIKAGNDNTVKIHIQANKNAMVFPEDLKIYLSGLGFLALKSDNGYLNTRPGHNFNGYDDNRKICWKGNHPIWSKPIGATVSSWNGMTFYEFVSDTGDYINEETGVQIKIEWKQLYPVQIPSAHWLSAPKDMEALNNALYSVETENLPLFTDGIDITVKFLDPSKTDVITIPTMTFVTNSYETGHYDFGESEVGLQLFTPDERKTNSVPFFIKHESGVIK